jgi:hypothetical protein
VLTSDAPLPEPQESTLSEEERQAVLARQAEAEAKLAEEARALEEKQRLVAPGPWWTEWR